jgi:hypothetical protein
MNTFPTGYITPDERTAAQADAHDAAVAKMPPRFALSGPAAPDPGPEVNLTTFWDHPAVAKSLGYKFTGTHQITGSCVGAGGGNVLFSLAVMEVLRLGDREKIVLPYWPYTYGISRMLLGETSEGEGSLGSTFAEAARTYGVLDNAEPALPKPTDSDGLVWGKSVEMQWSNGRKISATWTGLGKQHLVRSTAPIKSADELLAALRNYYPVTFACNCYVTPGNERAVGGYYVGRLDGNGGHQTSIQGFTTTPGGNVLFRNVNQWGLKRLQGTRQRGLYGTVGGRPGYPIARR